MEGSTLAQREKFCRAEVLMAGARGLKAHESDVGFGSGSGEVFRRIRAGSELRQRAPEVAGGKADRAILEFFAWCLGDESREHGGCRKFKHAAELMNRPE